MADSPKMHKVRTRNRPYDVIEVTEAQLQELRDLDMLVTEKEGN